MKESISQVKLVFEISFENIGYLKNLLVASKKLLKRFAEKLVGKYFCHEISIFYHPLWKLSNKTVNEIYFILARWKFSDCWLLEGALTVSCSQWKSKALMTCIFDYWHWFQTNHTKCCIVIRNTVYINASKLHPTAEWFDDLYAGFLW